MIKKIESSSNTRIKELIKLREKKSYREQTGTFFIEGEREFLRACEYGKKIQSIFYQPDLISQKIKNTIYDMNVELIEVSSLVFSKVSVREDSGGIVAIVKKDNLGVEEARSILKKTTSPFILIVEQVEKPGNLGAILRSCDGAGVDLVIVNNSVDWSNPNCIRSSLGGVFTVPIAEISCEDTLSICKEFGIRVVSTTPNTDSFYYDEDLSGAVAIVVGAESSGLTDFWLENSDINVKIPMEKTIDSLNVSVATSILLYEVLRQRKVK